jgi:hypothetical protein
MLQFILKENVLTDNVLLVAEKGEIFKGGYVAVIQEYVYCNAWSDTLLQNKKFKSLNSLFKYLSFKYKDTDINLINSCIN